MGQRPSTLSRDTGRSANARCLPYRERRRPYITAARGDRFPNGSQKRLEAHRAARTSHGPSWMDGRTGMALTSILALMHINDMFICMRTTINLDDGLMRDLKRLAADTGCTLTSVIHDALRESLWRRRNASRARVELPVFHGNGLQPGVDISDSASLLEIMENVDGLS